MAEDLDGSDVWRTAAGGRLAEVKRWANGFYSFTEKRHIYLHAVVIQQHLCSSYTICG